MSIPPWKQRYSCPQCPTHLQPTDGFGLVEFQEHIFSHTISVLREVTDEARQYRESLESIDALLRNESIAHWGSRIIRMHVEHHVDLSLRRYDDAYWVQKKKQLEEDRKRPMVPCLACGGSGEKK